MFRRISLAILASLSLSALACSGAGPQDSSAAQSDELRAHALPSPVGSWSNQDGDPDTLLFYAFQFKSDGTYSAMGGCRPGPTGPHCFAIVHGEGTWVTQKSGPQLGAPGGAAQLVLTDQFNQTNTYFYSIDGDQLSLSTIFRGEASVFTKDAPAKPAPGTEGGMCGGLAGIQCADGLECQTPNYPDADGTCVKVEAPKPGELGGTCGGFAGIPCKDGLVCQFSALCCDVPGVCVQQ
jgi:hypothetical protein